MAGDDKARVNGWGIAGILCLLAGFAADAVATAMGLQSRESGVPAFVLLFVSVICSAIAARRGRRWWLILTVVAVVFFVAFALGMIGE